MSKALHYPLDSKINTLIEVPYTISFVIRKRMQLDNINELPKEKRPSDHLIWDAPSDELNEWFNKVSKNKEPQNAEIVFLDSEIER